MESLWGAPGTFRFCCSEIVMGQTKFCVLYSWSASTQWGSLRFLFSSCHILVSEKCGLWFSHVPVQASGWAGDKSPHTEGSAQDVALKRVPGEPGIESEKEGFCPSLILLGTDLGGTSL